MKHLYGWKPDKPDIRDKYFPEALAAVELPPTVDLRIGCPPIYDQGQLGSCTANAIAAHLDFNRHKQGEAFITPSRLFIYYNERLDDGTVEFDAGSSIRESAKTVAGKGAPPETEWPYKIKEFAVQPPENAYLNAVKYEALTYFRLRQTELQFKQCLASGFPFVGGISVYESFEASTNGTIPMPKASEQLMGGHAILIVGYTPHAWIFRNSWGTRWGKAGYGLLPKDYLTHPDLARDFWTLRTVR